MTTGDSLVQAHQIVVANGGIPVGCLIAFDRQERGTGFLSAVQEFEEEYKVPVRAVATLTDLITVLRTVKKTDWSIVLQKVLDYQEEYGV
jgi:orotate phosphoribosyltransferase